MSGEVKTLTVKDVIEKLSTIDYDVEVFIYYPQDFGMYEPIESISIEKESGEDVVCLRSFE